MPPFGTLLAALLLFPRLEAGAGPVPGLAARFQGSAASCGAAIDAFDAGPAVLSCLVRNLTAGKPPPLDDANGLQAALDARAKKACPSANCTAESLVPLLQNVRDACAGVTDAAVLRPLNEAVPAVVGNGSLADAARGLLETRSLDCARDRLTGDYCVGRFELVRRHLLSFAPNASEALGHIAATSPKNEVCNECNKWSFGYWSARSNGSAESGFAASAMQNYCGWKAPLPSSDEDRPHTTECDLAIDEFDNDPTVRKCLVRDMGDVWDRETGLRIDDPAELHRVLTRRTELACRDPECPEMYLRLRLLDLKKRCAGESPDGVARRHKSVVAMFKRAPASRILGIARDIAARDCRADPGSGQVCFADRIYVRSALAGLLAGTENPVSTDLSDPFQSLNRTILCSVCAKRSLAEAFAGDGDGDGARDYQRLAVGAFEKTCGPGFGSGLGGVRPGAPEARSGNRRSLPRVARGSVRSSGLRR